MPSPASPEKRLLGRSIEWFLLTVCTFFIFYFLPVTFCDFNNANRTLFMLVAAWFSMQFFLVMATVNFTEWVDRTGRKDLDFGGWEYASTPFIVLAGLVVLFFRFEQRVENELKQHGRIVTGAIIAKEAEKKDYLYLKIRFNTMKGEVKTIKKDVTHDTNNELVDWTKVKLIYSERHPEIFRLFLDKENIQIYTGSQEKGMTAKALLELVETDSADLFAALDALNYGWEYTDSGWVNIPQRATLKVDTDSLLVYKKDGPPYMNISYELEPFGFKRLSGNLYTERLESPRYLVTENRTVHQVGYTILESSYVITVVKKRENSAEYESPG